MRIERIVVDRFGRLRDLDTGPGSLPGLVAVVGPNEAGKSTLFSFLTSLLYGFYPATRDSHPYTPWSGGDIEGRAVLRMEGGETWEIHRRLLSSPSGSLVRGEQESSLRNDTLACAEHVLREIFQQAFALRLAELASLEGRGWEQVQDRLVGEMGSGDLRPVRDVCEELEEAAGRLWRPNRRGNQSVREKRERIAELRSVRRDALERDRETRGMAREADELEAELEELREERIHSTGVLNRMTVLAPIRARLDRIALWEEEAGPLQDLLDLPADPEARMEELGERIRELDVRIEEAEERCRELEERREAFDPPSRRLVEERDPIRSLTADAGALDADLARLRALDQELRDMDRRGETMARDLLGVSWKDLDAEAVASVRTGEVRDQLRRYVEAREAHRAIREGAGLLHGEPGDTAPRPTFFPLGAGTAAVAVLLLVVAVATGRTGVGAAGAFLLVIGAALLWIGRSDRSTRERDVRRRRRRDEELRDRLREASLEERQAREDVLALLDPLPLRAGLVEAPSAELAGQVEFLQDHLRGRGEREEEREEISTRVEAFRKRLAELGDRLRTELPPDPKAAALILQQRLEDATTAERDCEAAERDLERLRRSLERDRAVRDEKEEERSHLVEVVEGMGDGDPALGLKRADARLRARDRAVELRRELEEEHPNLQEIRERIREAEERGEEWTVDERVIGETEALKEELTERIVDRSARLTELRTRIEHLREGVTVDQVDGEIDALEESVEAEVRERDRLWLLARIVREADRRFRERHQPELLRRAGAHLETITGGRYRRFLLSDGERGRGFSIRGQERSDPLPLGAPLSTGTLEQAYLALRLAVVDHLDRGGERLPLFMDEAFVNWDPERRERGFDLLRDVARSRQVFLFTCHEEMGRELEERGAGIVRLERP